ncbi:alpha/beta hydrolase [Cupriavidus basilensis]|uniref:Alpha/beta hydrolase n=1 Tax=Cupriavidus basilensis TaxID=68895 RepID=A0ABT6ART4_9BURK|nr:alpha/beta hydrolase [Cupriavidus basilensis]MDF3835335.1 alpha/beta hydrolase [Cupriavidus basilensis]
MHEASKNLYPVPPFNKRRRLTQALAALPFTLPIAGLTACGGDDREDASNLTPTVTDRRVALSTGVTLHVRDWNAANARRVVVLLGGHGENAQYFNGMAAELARRARVIAVSRRGYGQSEKLMPSTVQRYDPDTLVRDLESLLSRLGVGSAVLCGHSIAVNELTLFAGRYPKLVRGIVYMDTPFDYTRKNRLEDEVAPSDPALMTPPPQPSDGASFAAAVAYAKRIRKVWTPATEANLRDSLHVLPDGRVRPSTPEAVDKSMLSEALSFSPDYAAVKAPSLILAASPTSPRDLFPWLIEPISSQIRQEVETLLHYSRRRRSRTLEWFKAALPDSQQKIIANSSHADFFIEHQAEVVRAIESTGWY